jgi:hypothetical protein
MTFRREVPRSDISRTLQCTGEGRCGSFTSNRAGAASFRCSPTSGNTKRLQRLRQRARCGHRQLVARSVFERRSVPKEPDPPPPARSLNGRHRLRQLFLQSALFLGAELRALENDDQLFERSGSQEPPTNASKRGDRSRPPFASFLVSHQLLRRVLCRSGPSAEAPDCQGAGGPEPSHSMLRRRSALCSDIS